MVQAIPEHRLQLGARVSPQPLILILVSSAGSLAVHNLSGTSDVAHQQVRDPALGAAGCCWLQASGRVKPQPMSTSYPCHQAQAHQGCQKALVSRTAPPVQQRVREPARQAARRLPVRMQLGACSHGAGQVRLLQERTWLGAIWTAAEGMGITSPKCLT